MLSRLVNGPVHGSERLLVNDAQFWHDTQWIADTDAEGVTADSPCAHDLKRVHDFRDAPEGRVACTEWCIKRLTRRGNDVLVKTKPVHLRW